MNGARVGGGLATLVLCLGLTGCGETADGEVVAARESDVSGPSRSVVLPTGTLALTVGDAVAEVSGDDTQSGRALKAPSGSSFVPVRWDHDAMASPLDSRLAAQPQEAAMTLRVDDTSVPLGSPYAVTDTGKGITGDSATSVFVVVPGTPEPSDVTIDLEYDGRTAEVAFAEGADESGFGLGDLVDAAPTQVACPPEGWRVTGGVAVDMLCEGVTSVSTPYWPGTGWAAEGQQWVVASVDRLGPGRIVKGGARYTATDVTGSLNGEPLAGAEDHTLSGVVVLPDDTTDLALLVTVADAVLSSGEGPTKVSFEAGRVLRAG